MLVQDYFKDREYPLDHIWFNHDGCRHEGNGVMIWKPEAGFHIFSQVERNKPYPGRKQIRSISIDTPVCFKMKLKSGLWAFAPRIRLNELNLSRRWVSVDCDRVIFIQFANTNLNKTTWSGSALLEPVNNLILPDTVLSETRIGGSGPIESVSDSGIWYEDEVGQKLIGYINDNKRIKIDWSLPKVSWTKENSWHFAEALKDAISITAGEVLQLLYHQSFRGKQIVTEIRAKSQPTSLGILFRLMDKDIPDKKTIVQLANCLTNQSPESEVCRQIFQQVSAASQQVTLQAKELMLSTILEAALRTFYAKPFEPTNNKRTDSFSLTSSLKRFRETYLSPDPELGRRWRKATNEVLKAQRRLRDRNAHPDWLLTQGGSYSDEKLEQTMNDLILLSRFYGYLILAIAGFGNLRPVFPKPFDEWSPILTISRFGSDN